MSLYFKFEEDTMKNEISAVIFLIIFPDIRYCFFGLKVLDGMLFRGALNIVMQNKAL